MGFWSRLLKRRTQEESVEQTGNRVQEDIVEPELHYEEIPATLNLGWYWSVNKDAFQMAKIAEKDRATNL